jgi:cytochrome c-type biogenesis protein CcmH/NrfG
MQKRHSPPLCGWPEVDVKRISSLFLIAATMLLAACTSTTPPPATTPTGDDRFLVDPRLGAPAAPPNVDTKFDLAWRYLLAGNQLEARKQLDAIRKKSPHYLPAQLAEAALFLRDHQVDKAREIVDTLLSKEPQYTAAEIYRAEIAITDGDTRRAFDLYRSIARDPQAPEMVRERIVELRRTLFDRLVTGAQSVTDREAIRMLREALELDPSVVPTRILLAQKLVATRDFDGARKELDPILKGGDADRTEVQQILGEIEVGRGRYQEAIVRYERLAHRDPSFTARLDQIKGEFAAANMPLQYQRALEAEAITRADLAVLLYWKVVSIRFAQNIGAPPIAVDVTDTLGREEIVRALALGIYAVDPVTRRAGVGTNVNATSLARIGARVLVMRGAACARNAGSDPSETGRAQKVLAACKVSDPTLTLGSDAPVSGRAAAATLEQIDRALR